MMRRTYPIYTYTYVYTYIFQYQSVPTKQVYDITGHSFRIVLSLQDEIN